jgi:hypothetical protein
MSLISLKEKANPHTKSSVVNISTALSLDLLSYGLSKRVVKSFLRYSMMMVGKLAYSLLSFVATWGVIK